VQFDLLRAKPRLLHGWGREVASSVDKLHLGCGFHRIPGWLNVDVAGSDFDWDLGCGRLLWKAGTSREVLSQQLGEHLGLERELLPLLREVRRVSANGAEIWLACPDMEKVCRSYLEHRGSDLVRDRH
jgi:predicted SAM-dependent methyltransferase